MQTLPCKTTHRQHDRRLLSTKFHIMCATIHKEPCMAGSGAFRNANVAKHAAIGIWFASFFTMQMFCVQKKRVSPCLILSPFASANMANISFGATHAHCQGCTRDLSKKCVVHEFAIFVNIVERICVFSYSNKVYTIVCCRHMLLIHQKHFATPSHLTWNGVVREKHSLDFMYHKRLHKDFG